MLESDNPFFSGSALAALSQWSGVLKSFQSRIGQHFACSEARQSAFDDLQALMSPVERNGALLNRPMIEWGTGTSPNLR